MCPLFDQFFWPRRTTVKREFERIFSFSGFACFHFFLFSARRMGKSVHLMVESFSVFSLWCREGAISFCIMGKGLDMDSGYLEGRTAFNFI